MAVLVLRSMDDASGDLAELVATTLLQHGLRQILFSVPCDATLGAYSGAEVILNCAPHTVTLLRHRFHGTIYDVWNNDGTLEVAFVRTRNQKPMRTIHGKPQVVLSDLVSQITRLVA